MAQMKNEFYKYNNDSFTKDTVSPEGNFMYTTTYYFRDYTSLKYYKVGLWDEVTDENWVQDYFLEDDEKIETVSVKMYDNPDYWDLILAINSKNPLFDMVYNYDSVEASVQIYLEDYEKDYAGTLTPAHKEKLTTLFLNDKLKNIEFNRRIKVIRPSKLEDFFRLLKDREFYTEDE